MSKLIKHMKEFPLPPELDGSRRLFLELRDRCRLDVRNDVEAIELWLVQYTDRENTYRMYRQQVERCLIWAVCVRNKPFSTITASDAHQFSEFLLNPRWGEYNRASYVATDWPPFKDPLSPRSRDCAIRVLSSLFDWLMRRSYVDDNPWRALPFDYRGKARREFAPLTTTYREKNAVTVREWGYITRAIELLPSDEQWGRAKLVMLLAYFGGLKPRELADLTGACFAIAATGSDGEPLWSMSISSRPCEREKVYLLPPLRKGLEEYLTTLGMTLESLISESSFLLLGGMECNPGELAKNISKPSGMMNYRNELSRSAKRVFAVAADQARHSDDNAAEQRLSRATIGWLSDSLELHALQLNLGEHCQWQMLGACKFISPSTAAYLPSRSEISIDVIYRSIVALEPLWRIP